MTNVGEWLTSHANLNRLDAELLLADTLGVVRSRIIAFPEQSLCDAQLRKLDAAAERLANGEPLAYLLGRCEFYSMTLQVTPATLIPRPDTELLVDTALDKLGEQTEDARVLDLGTGSGAIAIALACNSQAEIVATDASVEALAVAARNAKHHDASVRFLQGDWLDAVSGRFTLIVSNPPYIAEQDDHLPALRFEPDSALVSGSDGLTDLRRICQTSAVHLHQRGWLILEHGYDQAEAVRTELTTAGFTRVETHRDLAGLERVTAGQWIQAACTQT